MGEKGRLHPEYLKSLYPNHAILSQLPTNSGYLLFGADMHPHFTLKPYEKYPEGIGFLKSI